MSRTLLALLVPVLMLTSTRAAADTFGGWRYSAPPGYTSETNEHHVALTQVTDSTFCTIAIFESRRLERPIAAERAYEFYNTVTHAFAVHVRQRGTLTTKLGPVTTTTATLVDADNHRYAATHFVITPPDRIGSVLALADSHTSLASCAAVATRVVRSLDIDWASPRITDPEARVETPQGRWTSRGREYAFAADGTYRFPNETGTYTVLANQLTLTPNPRTTAKRRTYSWNKRYAVETNEWFLVLTAKSTSIELSDAARPLLLVEP